MSLTFSTYVTTWGTASTSQDPLQLINDMIAKNALQAGTRIILAFASFNFTSPSYIPGFGNVSMIEVQQITSLVHAHGGKVSLSIGGATYPFYGSDMYTRPGDLADNINQICNTCGFDGVDFDIEDYYGNVPSNFATQAASLINTLRSLNAGLYITLTTPAQAWGSGMYQQSLLNMTIGSIDKWQPMEYDLWVDPINTYAQQIESDIQYYIHTWGVDPAKMVLGLMPGPDDIPRVLSLQDALNLTSFAINSGLGGVMTWDANIDSFGVDGNAPYAYVCGIQSMCNKTQNKRANKFKNTRLNRYVKFN